MPKISVIVPVYNVEKYIHRCIDSILAQTFSDFELILVDDGSPDNCQKICDKYAEKDSRIKVIHKENGGLSSARNAGMKHATGEWICFVDSDDIIHPQMLEILYNAVKDTSAQIAVCDCIQNVTVPDNFYCLPQISYEYADTDENYLLKLYSEKNRAYWTVIPKLIKSCIALNHPFTEGRIYEDNALSEELLFDAKNIALTNAQLYFYRTNPDGIMNERFTVKKLDFLWALEEQMKFFDGIGYRKICNAVAGQYINDSIWLSGRVYKELNNKKLAKQTIDKMRENIKKYAPEVKISKEQERKIFKLLHPVLHKIKKKQIKRLPS